MYTVAVVFSVGDYGDMDQLWVAHFTRRKDAVRAFLLKTRECGQSSTEEDFETVLSTGSHYSAYAGSEESHVYVRHEKLQDSFDEEENAWA